MAGNVPKRILKQPEVDKCLLGGTRLWKFEEVHTTQKLIYLSVLHFRGSFIKIRSYAWSVLHKEKKCSKITTEMLYMYMKKERLDFIF